jgi:hypothetical protein
MDVIQGLQEEVSVLNNEYHTIQFQNDSYCDATGTIYQNQTFAKTIHDIPAVYWKSPGEGILTPSSCCHRIWQACVFCRKRVNLLLLLSSK